MSGSRRDGEILIAIPVLLLGGTELHTLALARTLKAAGARPRVCCYYEYSPSMVTLFERAGIEVTLLRMKRTAGLWQLFWTLCRMFKRNRPAVVHVQYIAPGLVPVVAARAAGVGKVFATVHQPGDGFGSRERLLFAAAARLCTAFFCVSQAVECSWFGDSAVFSSADAAFGRRHFTIYNGVDVGRVNDEASQAANTELRNRLCLTGRRVIGVVGRLRAEKGHALLLRAMPNVLKVVPEATLLVVGDGPEREAMQEQGKALGIESNIIWAGERSPDDVLALYGVMEVVAIPSVFEGFGLSAAEAMAAGCPVVGTRVGGLPELVEDGVTGHLVAPGDSGAFAEALILTLADRKMAAALGARGRRRVSEQFSSERFGKMIVEAYRYFSADRAVPGATGR